MALAAESITFVEMIQMQELSTMIPDILKEWQDKETRDLLADQMWNEMTEEWTEHMYGEGQSRAGIDEDLQRSQNTGQNCPVETAKIGNFELEGKE